MDRKSADAKLARIAEIDRMFEGAVGWGSWMAGASAERKGLVNALKRFDGIEVEHRPVNKEGWTHMTARKNDSYFVADIQGEIANMLRFITSELGYDKSPSVEVHFESSGKFCLRLTGGDHFQKNRDLNSRIGELWEADWAEDLETLFKQGWEALQKQMRRDERELRFGLAQLGDSIEGEGFNTEIGKMIYQRLKATRDEISAKFLPKFEKK